MLIKEDRDSKELPAEPEVGVRSTESPPAYNDLPSPSSAVASSSSTRRERIPPNFPASNFLTIRRDNSSIKETYVVDPGLSVPSELLVDDESEDGARKNLEVSSKNGSVSTEIWLVDSSPASNTEVSKSAPEHERKRVTLEAKSHNGSVTVKLRTTTNLPFSLVASSKNGSVTVAIPSTFVGPVTLATNHGSTKFSEAVTERLITFSEVDKKRVCFIGDFRAAGYSSKESWTGSVLDMTTPNGSLRLSFIEEEDSEDSSAGGFNFWSRLFRLK